jgi:hypothetical protein
VKSEESTMTLYIIIYIIILSIGYYSSVTTADAFSVSLSLEEQAVFDQLGYLPDNFVRISAWTEDSVDENHGGPEPVAIQCYPLNGGAKRRQRAAKTSHTNLGTPFPTLFWLTSPSISKAIGGLEREGYIQMFDKRINGDPEMARRLLHCHKENADMRWQSLSQEDRQLLLSDNPSVQRMRNILQNSGVSGTNFTHFAVDDDDVDSQREIVVPSIKCLHTHYGHYRSTRAIPDATINPVGEMIHEQLRLYCPELNL